MAIYKEKTPIVKASPSQKEETVLGKYWILKDNALFYVDELRKLSFQVDTNLDMKAIKEKHDGLIRKKAYDIINNN